jgi:flagellar motility protein MotE (MotC chaperone)
MNRRDRLHNALLRVRRLERDRSRREHLRSQGERRAAEDVAARKRAEAAAGGFALQRAGEAGTIAAIWRVANAGVAALQLGAQAGRSSLAAAEEREVRARDQWQLAERAVAGLERLAERRALAERDKALRAAQRVIDDTVRQRRRRAPLLTGLLIAAWLFPAAAPQAQAEIQAGSVSLERLLSDIRSRSRELDQRESELAERERSVAELERAVDARLNELESVARRIELRIEEWEESRGAKTISKLAKIYAEMPAPVAAELVEELELDLATAVLAKMKPKQSAALLPLLSEPRALSISRFVGHPLGITPTPAAPETK